MPRLDDEVLDELRTELGNLSVHGFIELLEQHHRSDEPGVSRDLVEEYFDALEERSEFAVGSMREQFGARLTDERTTASRDAVYEVGDGRVSAYPASWHEQLGDGGSLADLVRVMTESGDRTLEGAASTAVREDDLLDAATAVGGMSRQEARDRLEDLREDGVLVADADQHPRAGISLTEDAEVETGESDDSDRSAE